MSFRWWPQIPSEHVVTIANDVLTAADNQGVWPMNDMAILIWIRQRGQEVLHTIDPCPFFIRGFDNGPRRICGVRVKEHGFFGFGIFVPFGQRGPVNGRQLPLLERVDLA